MKQDIENIIVKKHNELFKIDFNLDYNTKLNLQRAILDSLADEVLKVVVEKINKVHNEEIEELNNSNNQELTKKYISAGLEIYKDSLLSNLSHNKENKNNGNK